MANSSSRDAQEAALQPALTSAALKTARELHSGGSTAQRACHRERGIIRSDVPGHVSTWLPATLMMIIPRRPGCRWPLVQQTGPAFFFSLVECLILQIEDLRRTRYEV